MLPAGQGRGGGAAAAAGHLRRSGVRIIGTVHEYLS